MEYDNRDMIDAIEGIRRKLNQEHEPAWQAAVQAAVSEIQMTAAEQVIRRSEAARTRLFNTLVASLPEPAPAPLPLHSEPVQFNQANGHHYQDDLDQFDDDVVIAKRFAGGRA